MRLDAEESSEGNRGIGVVRICLESDVEILLDLISVAILLRCCVGGTAAHIHQCDPRDPSIPDQPLPTLIPAHIGPEQPNRVISRVCKPLPGSSLRIPSCLLKTSFEIAIVRRHVGPENAGVRVKSREQL